jgi:hypothetical protein
MPQYRENTDGRILKTIERRFCVQRESIGYLKFILEGYEGMAVMTTRDTRAGVVSVFMAPGCESDIMNLLDCLAKEIFLLPSAPEEGPGAFPESHENSTYMR